MSWIPRGEKLLITHPSGKCSKNLLSSRDASKNFLPRRTRDQKSSIERPCRVFVLSCSPSEISSVVHRHFFCNFSFAPLRLQRETDFSRKGAKAQRKAKGGAVERSVKDRSTARFCRVAGVDVAAAARPGWCSWLRQGFDVDDEAESALHLHAQGELNIQRARRARRTDAAARRSQPAVGENNGGGRVHAAAERLHG